MVRMRPVVTWEFPGAVAAGMIAEDWCLAEEKALYVTPFSPLSTDLPPKTRRCPHW
jgi:hypothetical protein